MIVGMKYSKIRSVVDTYVTTDFSQVCEQGKGGLTYGSVSNCVLPESEKIHLAEHEIDRLCFTIEQLM